MIIDTHCHLDNEVYYEDVHSVIQEALDNGVKSFIIPGASLSDLPQAVALSEKYSEVFFSVGTHPYDINTYDEVTLKQYIHHPKCVAVGECGLDYYRLPEDPIQAALEIKQQKEIFIKQIKMALAFNKPLIIHIRDANDDARKILIENHAKLVGGVLHCFNASEHLLLLQEHNFYFGIGGVLTFKNAKNLTAILPKIPKDRLLLETDAPYLTPVPFRGKRNKPSYTTYVAQKMSELLNTSLEEIESLTTNNALTLFKGLNKY